MHPLLRAYFPVAVILVGTASTPVWAQQQTRAQQICINALNTGLLKISVGQDNASQDCLRKYAAGEIAGVDACVANPGFVNLAQSATCRAEALHCTGVPPSFGATGCATIDPAAQAETKQLLKSILPNDSDIALCSIDRTKCACQSLLLRRTTRVHKTLLQGFTKCKRLGLASGTITSADDLLPCFLSPRTAKRVERAEARLANDAGVRCPGVVNPFAGQCNGLSGLALAKCLSSVARCRACEAMNRADFLSRDCDALDDGMANASCQRQLGEGCSTDARCLSGHCVDGLCCDSACNGACVACAKLLTSQADGTCAPIAMVGATDTAPTALCSAGTGCVTDNCACDGAGSCKGVSGSSLCSSGPQCISGGCSSSICD